MENGQKMVIFKTVCCHGNSLQHTHINEKKNPRCVVNLHCECQELKPKGETNNSFLVLHPSSGVHTVKLCGATLSRSNARVSRNQRKNYAINCAIQGDLKAKDLIGRL